MEFFFAKHLFIFFVEGRSGKGGVHQMFLYLMWWGVVFSPNRTDILSSFLLGCLFETLFAETISLVLESFPFCLLWEFSKSRKLSLRGPKASAACP